MIRQIIKIDEAKCNGCGLCVEACHEGAIGLVDGKARLLRDDYCDGLGNCLPVCPTGAISFEEREAAAFSLPPQQTQQPAPQAPPTPCCHVPRRATQWPLQIKLVPINAPYFAGADLLIAADCTAFAYAGFYQEFVKDHITLIGCPKLDSGDYSEKLTEILRQNDIKSVTVTRMEVPCCGGLPHAVMQALQNCGKNIPAQIVTISTDGQIIV